MRADKLREYRFSISFGCHYILKFTVNGTYHQSFYKQGVELYVVEIGKLFRRIHAVAKLSAINNYQSRGISIKKTPSTICRRRISFSIYIIL